MFRCLFLSAFFLITVQNANGDEIVMTEGPYIARLDVTCYEGGTKIHAVSSVGMSSGAAASDAFAGSMRGQLMTWDIGTGTWLTEEIFVQTFNGTGATNPISTVGGKYLNGFLFHYDVGNIRLPDGEASAYAVVVYEKLPEQQFYITTSHRSFTPGTGGIDNFYRTAESVPCQ